MADEVIKTELLDRATLTSLLEMYYGTTLWKRMVEIP